MVPGLDDLVRNQASVATRRQLAAAGFPDDRLRAQLDARRWQSVNDAVVVLHNGPLTPEQQLWVAYLSAQRPAAGCGLTAMEAFGVTGLDPGGVHILVRRGARVLPVQGFRVHVHESRRFDASDIWPAGRPIPVTSLPRAVIDAAAWSREVQHACRLVTASVQQRRTTADELAAALIAAGSVRHRKTLHALIRDLGGGAQALSEVEFLAFCRRHRLPRPDLQVRLDWRGRRRYLDATFRRRDGRPVRVEIDGGVHLTVAQRWRDTRNDNDAIIAGEMVLRFSSFAIYTDDRVAVEQLRRALGPVST